MLMQMKSLKIWFREEKSLVVGGSGFFLQGFLQPVVDALEVSDEVRNHVNTTYEKYGIDTTLAQLGKLNPKGLGNLGYPKSLRVISGTGEVFAV